jgi:hypothetical protein
MGLHVTVFYSESSSSFLKILFQKQIKYFLLIDISEKRILKIYLQMNCGRGSRWMHRTLNYSWAKNHRYVG